jgi:hypothetical protein
VQAAQFGVGAFELLALLVVLLDESVDSLLEPSVSCLGGAEADV